MYVVDQEERSIAVDQFRKGEKDVLVATDIASKGLDFPNVQHVINYDMPEDIENYGDNAFLFTVIILMYVVDIKYSGWT